MAEEESKGLIHIYTGDGKGKTTAALGLAMRASGQGLRVAFIQFLKGQPCGEHLFASQHHPFDIIQISVGDSFSKPKEQLSQEAQETLAYAERETLSGNYDLVVLDEVFVAISRDLITIKQVLDLLDEKPSSVELVMTGRRAPPEIVKRADLVTEMLLIKHPFTDGITARRGIEY
ncbi:MAG: cob(I)yrinic acid a,c-diamide adenosyltransferase [Dehalococcoidia bacterium]|nr:cob(I)yrinic acid a,c-diamide adenosyltransferase [Dehalococcoidia bacterium]